MLAAAFRARKHARFSWAVGAAMLAALAVRAALPAEHQVFYDEYEHLDIAANLRSTFSFALTRAGGLADVNVLAPSPWPGAHHLVVALLGSGFGWSLAAGVLAVGVLGAFGWPAAALWALLPLPALFSRAADLTSTAALLAAAALAACALHAQRRERRTEALAVALVALAAHARFENVVLALALRASPAGWAALAAAVAPLGVLVGANSAAGVPGFTGFGDLAAQLPRNLLWLASSPDRAAVVVLAALGAWRKKTPLYLGLAAAYLLVYSSFYRGLFDVSSECRFAVLVLLPLAAQAAAAPRAAVLAGLVVLAASQPWKPRLLPHGHHEEQAFLREAAPLLPKDAYTLALNPSAVRVMAGAPAATLETLADPRVLALLEGRGGAVLRDYWWQARPAQGIALRDVLESRWRLEPILEREVGGSRRAVYRLTRR